jgi:transglutaminase-like putative cysteine protease
MLIDADAAAAHIRVMLAHTAPEARGDLHQTGARRQRLPMPVAASMRLRPALRKPKQIFRFQSHRDLPARSAAEGGINCSAASEKPNENHRIESVKRTSDKIITDAGAKTEIEKARAVYEWIVDNTFRDAQVRGCGIGDIAAMLTTGNLAGKCADLNALYVGLARAAGLPARDVYGIRIAPSKFGYKSRLRGNQQRQRCRSEVYLAGFGWVPVDAADVRKVVLEEPPTNLATDDPKVIAARKTSIGWRTTSPTTSHYLDRAAQAPPS